VLTRTCARKNFLPGKYGLEPKRRGDELVLALPMGRAKMSGIAVRDIGGCAAGLFLDPEGTIGKTIGISGDHLTGDEYANVFSSVRATCALPNLQCRRT
jgi:hypothetical protein